MKRSGPPQRRKPLKADPEKTRAFVERGRGSLPRRGGLSSPTAKPGLRKGRKKRPPEGPLDPATWAQKVLAASGGRSILAPARATNDPPHHVISKQELRRRRLFDRVWDERNGVALTLAEHDMHERGMKRVPRAALPARVFEFAAECGPWALDYIERHYPTEEVSDGTRA